MNSENKQYNSKFEVGSATPTPTPTPTPTSSSTIRFEEQGSQANFSDDSSSESEAPSNRIQLLSTSEAPVANNSNVFQNESGSTRIQITAAKQQPQPQPYNQTTNLKIVVTPQQLPQMSPSLMRLTPKSTPLVTPKLSHIQSAQQQAAISKHFEIRWQNINLYAQSEKSSWSDIVRSSLLVKCLCYGKKQSKQFDFELESESQIDEKKRHDIEELKSQQHQRQILNNVSGSVQSGQLTAILGPSGAGKTTLLNSLTGRNTLEGNGNVRVLGDGAKKRLAVATVPQSDVLPEQLTAGEDLMFTSQIKNANNKNKSFNHKQNVERVANLLNIKRNLSTRISKLSGGETRRLSIARELLNSPDILILDEPTSGLDANTCRKLIAALRDLAETSGGNKRRPICMLITIHQPQLEVLQLFHKCYVMASGGRVVFEGPPNQIMPTLLEHTSLSKHRPIDELNENPAVVIIEVASGEFGTEIIDELAAYQQQRSLMLDSTGVSWPSPALTLRSRSASRLSEHRLDRIVTQRAAAIATNATGDGSSPFLTPKFSRMSPLLVPKHLQHLSVEQLSVISAQTTNFSLASDDSRLPPQVSKMIVDKRLRGSAIVDDSFLRHTWVLMKRNWLLNTRNLLVMFVRIMGFLLVASGVVNVFSGAIDKNEHGCPVYSSNIDDINEFFDTTKTRLSNTQEIVGQTINHNMLYHHLLLAICMVISAITGLTFPLQLRMFQREFNNSWYSASSFMVSQTLAELPVDIIGPIIAVMIVYPLCGQPTSVYYWRELSFILIVCLSTLVCKSQAQMMSTFLVNSVQNSVFASCVMVCPPMLLSGIPVSLMHMSKLVTYVTYFSFLRYSFEAMFVIRYGYNLCPCNPEIVTHYPPTLSTDVMPAQLERMMKLVLNYNGFESSSSTQETAVINGTDALPNNQNNLLISLVRLLSDANNHFAGTKENWSSCSKYKSINLLTMDLEDFVLVKWTLALIVIFVVSRLLTYYAVKAVIAMKIIKIK